MRILDSVGSLAYPYVEYSHGSSSQDVCIVYLHGSGDGGSDFDRLERWSLPKIIRESTSFAYRTFCPLCPENERWEPERVSEFLIQLGNRISGQKCLILTGYSMGATGALDLHCKFPGLIDGLVIVAGRTKIVHEAHLSRVPILAIYGGRDERLSSSRIYDLRERINGLGGQLELIVYPEQDHYMPNLAYSDSRFYSWLAERREN